MTNMLRFKPTAVLKLTGEDSAEFLQGQFSQDLRGAVAGELRYGFWLDRKGRVAGDAGVGLDAEGAWWIFSDSLGAADLGARLESFIIADDVVIEDLTATWFGFRLWSADGSMTEAPKKGWTWTRPQGLSLGPGEVWWFIDDPAAEPSGATAVTAEAYEHERIRRGIPRVGRDIASGDLPQEGGLDAVGVSFNKGCYLGQEVMARVKSLGRVRRGLMPVAGAGAVPSGYAPVAIWQGDRQVGELRSRQADPAGGWLGLAMLNVSAREVYVPLRTGPEPDAPVCRERKVKP